MALFRIWLLVKKLFITNEKWFSQFKLRILPLFQFRNIASVKQPHLSTANFIILDFVSSSKFPALGT